MTKTVETTQVRASASPEAGSIRERPILFSSSMVRAILDGKKTQTRRIVRIDDAPISKADWDKGKRQRGIPSNAQNVRMIGYLKCDAPPGSYAVSSRVDCPYWDLGGSRLWVRETWAPADAMAGIHDTDLDTPQCVAYAADRTAVVFGHDLKARKADTYAWNWDRLKWRPSIFMPRWASRITLEVTAVRVERLRDISEEDAAAEGIEPLWSTRKVYPSKHAAEVQTQSFRDGFRVLWDDINGKRAPWASNPWLWVVSFRRVETP